MSDHKDAVVIGASIGGLVAATYLARAGYSVSLLEAEDHLGGSCAASASLAGARSVFGGDAIRALDPMLISDLGLRGLKFAVRDMPLVALDEDGRHLVIGRDPRAVSRALAPHSSADAVTYWRLHSDIFALARAMRPLWWEGAQPKLNTAQTRRLSSLRAASAFSFLNVFETGMLKATLAFDAASPLQPGSALALVWNAAQEMCGLQSAVAVPSGGLTSLVDALAAAARSAGVEIRTRARVDRLIVHGSMARGVALETGEEVFGRTVVSSLSRRKTLLALAPRVSAGFAETQRLMRAVPRSGEASILFLLNAAPEFGGVRAPRTARFVIADRMESYAAAATASRERQLPDDLLLEVTVPTATDLSLAPPGQHVVSVRVKGLPLEPKGGWPALTGKLIERVIATLEPHTVHLRERIVGTDVRMPVEEEEDSAARMMAPCAVRISTSIEGLFLCGTSAEPMNAVSGRAGRLAAGIANTFIAREKRA